MRYSLIFSVLLLLPFGAHAQKVQTLLRGGEKIVAPGGITARVVQGKMLPNLERKIVQSSSFIQMRHHVQTPVRFSSNLPLNLSNPTFALERAALEEYTDIMSQFRKFKKEMDPLLYYQARSSSYRKLEPAEKRQWLDRLAEMKLKLDILTITVSPEEKNLAAARQYIAYATETVEPLLEGINLQRFSFERTDRVLKKDEFFLRSPSQVDGVIQPPQGLEVIIVNDDSSVLSALQAAHDKGELFAGNHLYTYRSVKKLLQHIEQDGLKPDFILTDMMLPGGSGYYLTTSLRLQERNIPVIALSGYPEDESIAQEMFSHGLDGLVSLPVDFSGTKDWIKRLDKALTNYVYYRQINGWSR